MSGKEKTISKESYFLIALSAVTIFTLIPFIFTGFATGDDIEYYITFHTQDIWARGFEYAQNNGRFYFAFMMPIFYEWLPYVFDSFIVPKLINVIFVAVNYFLVALIVKELFNNRWLGFLCYLIGMVLISVKGVNNPIVSYPIYFSLSFSLILYALYAAIKFQQTALNKYRITAVVSFALGLLFYENYFIYLPLIAGFMVYSEFSKKQEWTKKLKNSFIILLPFGIVVFCYLCAYVSWRIIFDQYSYNGATVSSDNSLLDVLNTITSLSQGAYPLFFYFSGHSIFLDNSYILTNHVHGLPNVFLHAKIEWIFKAIIIGLLCFYILQKIEAVNKRKMLYVGLLGIVFIYAPQLLLAFTEKYMSLVKCCGLSNYVTTYFSVFPVAIVLAIVLVIPVFYIKRNVFLNAYKMFITVLLGLASVVNDYSNDHALTDLRNPLYTFQALEEFVKTEEFKRIPENAGIYTPQLYKSNSEISYMFAQAFEWSNYFSFKSGKTIWAPKTSQDFPTDSVTQFYYLNYGHNRKTEDQFFAWAPMKIAPASLPADSIIYSDSATVYNYSTYKSFSILLHTKNIPSDSLVTINGKTLPMKNNYLEVLVKYRNQNDFFKPIYLKAKDINVKSIQVFHNSSSQAEVIELD